VLLVQEGPLLLVDPADQPAARTAQVTLEETEETVVDRLMEQPPLEVEEREESLAALTEAEAEAVVGNSEAVVAVVPHLGQQIRDPVVAEGQVFFLMEEAFGLEVEQPQEETPIPIAQVL
jgi:hypothetical protein